MYIPNKEVMFKLMRACIKVNDPSELWIWGSYIAIRVNYLNHYQNDVLIFYFI